MVTIPNQKLASMVIQNEIKIQQGEQQNCPDRHKFIRLFKIANNYSDFSC